ncbi:beta and beta-prime subunits of DNA dependent RNA-polymerase, partial [Rhizophagus irregularis]
INEPTAYNLEQKTPEKYFTHLRIDDELLKEVEASEGYSALSEQEKIDAKRHAVLKKYFEQAPIIHPFRKKFLGSIIAEVFKRFHITETSKMLDRMKDLGFKYSTKAGITVIVSVIVVLPEKKVDKVTVQFRRGLITEEERYDRVISSWSAAKDEIQSKLMDSLPNTNPIFMMSDSGARGNASNFTQLA